MWPLYLISAVLFVCFAGLGYGCVAHALFKIQPRVVFGLRSRVRWPAFFVLGLAASATCRGVEFGVGCTLPGNYWSWKMPFPYLMTTFVFDGLAFWFLFTAKLSIVLVWLSFVYTGETEMLRTTHRKYITVIMSGASSVYLGGLFTTYYLQYEQVPGWAEDTGSDTNDFDVAELFKAVWFFTVSVVLLVLAFLVVTSLRHRRPTRFSNSENIRLSRLQLVAVISLLTFSGRLLGCVLYLWKPWQEKYQDAEVTIFAEHVVLELVPGMIMTYLMHSRIATEVSTPGHKLAQQLQRYDQLLAAPEPLMVVT